MVSHTSIFPGHIFRGHPIADETKTKISNSTLSTFADRRRSHLEDLSSNGNWLIPIESPIQLTIYSRYILRISIWDAILWSSDEHMADWFECILHVISQCQLGWSGRRKPGPKLRLLFSNKDSFMRAALPCTRESETVGHPMYLLRHLYMLVCVDDMHCFTI